MISDTGVITSGDRVVGQIQLITDDKGDRRCQLYNSRGIFLCETPFVGDDSVGYEHGMSLYNGYTAGFDNCEYAISKSINSALRNKFDLQIG